MTDIQTAIKELREAINGGEGWPTIHRAYDALDRAVLERYGVNNPIDAMRQLDWALTKSVTGTFVNVETYLKQLEEAVCVPSVTVIQAARDVISQSGFVIINEGRSNEVEVYATDEKAIARLRAALTAIESAVGEWDGPIGYALRCDIDIENDIWECVLSSREDAEGRREELQRTTGFKFDILALYASPTPDLTTRIEAAAEEFVNKYWEFNGSVKDGARLTLISIIKRYLEGGK